MPESERLKQEDHEFKACLSDMVRPFQQQSKTKNNLKEIFKHSFSRQMITKTRKEGINEEKERHDMQKQDPILKESRFKDCGKGV